MGMDMKQFWREVRNQRQVIAKQLDSNGIAGQPEYSEDAVRRDFENPNIVEDLNTVYITSQQLNSAGTAEGFICLATVKLAGQRIAEQTHRLSTPEEIKMYTAQQRKARAAIIKENDESKVKALGRAIGESFMPNNPVSDTVPVA